MRKTEGNVWFLGTFEETKTGLIDFVPAAPEVRWRSGVDPPWADFGFAARLGLFFRGAKG